MAGERVSMRSVRQLLRLAWEAKQSQAAVGRACGLSKGAVNKYLRLAALAGLKWPLPENLDDEALDRLVRAPNPPPPSKFPTPQ